MTGDGSIGSFNYTCKIPLLIWVIGKQVLILYTFWLIEIYYDFLNVVLQRKNMYESIFVSLVIR